MLHTNHVAPEAYVVCCQFGLLKMQFYLTCSYITLGIILAYKMFTCRLPLAM